MAARTSRTQRRRRPVAELTFPTRHDEDLVNLKLYGNNETKHIAMNGWTRKHPVSYVGLKTDLKIAAKDVLEELDLSMLNCSVKLKELTNKAGWNYSRLPNPIVVHILEKKTLEAFVKEKQLLVFGDMIVGDETGFCELHTCNDSVWSFYEQVNVGDKLVIGVGKFANGLRSKSNRRDEKSWFTSSLDENSILNLDIKINCFDCRQIIKMTQSSGVLPATYTARRQLLTVSNLLTPNLNDSKPLDGKPESCHFDVIGVICHVGRMERYRDLSTVVQLESGDEKLIPFFRVFRWIELIDKNSDSIVPLQLYISHDMWPVQSSIISGTPIVITNVQRHRTDFQHARLLSTRFSQVIVNNEIRSYSHLYSTQIQNVVTEFLRETNAKAISEKKNVIWSVGGTYATPFGSEQKFINFVKEKSHGNPSEPNVSLRHILTPGFDEYRFLRRETRRFIFKGFIKKYGKVSDAGWDVNVMTRNRNKSLSDEFEKDYDQFNSTKFSLPHQNWYMFTRKLPSPVAVSPSPRKRTRSRSPRKSQVPEPEDPFVEYEKLSSVYKKYCDSLCMPASGDPELLKNLPALDCFPCFLIQLVNQDADPHEQYFCIWKSNRFMSFQQMETKLKKIINSKLVYFMIDVHLIEESPEKVVEIILQDLAVPPRPPPNR